MSDTKLKIVTVQSVEAHSQDDRLEIVKALNTQFIANKGDFFPGKLCFYFPPNIFSPRERAKGICNEVCYVQPSVQSYGWTYSVCM